MISLATSPFERFAAGKGYNITPAVSPCPARAYADSRTQEVFDAFKAGAASVARVVTESTLETPALVERIRAMAGE